MKKILVISLFLFTSIAVGQRLQTPTLSPISKIEQQIGLTKVSLEYSRPSAKGRVIFGDLVPLDEIWRTGANASTKITFEEAAYIGGNPIDSGTYALYTIPGKKEWTVIIHSNLKMRSLAGDAYKPENDVFRFVVPVKSLSDFVETFTFQFTDLQSDSTNLLLSWENTSIAIPIAVEVDAKIDAQMQTLLVEPEKIPHRTYFSAAQYYLTNDKDLDTAESWIDAALEKSPENFRYGLLKAKIQYKNRKTAEAMSTIEQAHKWAIDANNANYIGQTSLFMKSIKK